MAGILGVYSCVRCHQDNTITEDDLQMYEQELTEAVRPNGFKQTERIYIIKCKYCGERNRIRVPR